MLVNLLDTPLHELFSPTLFTLLPSMRTNLILFLLLLVLLVVLDGNLYGAIRLHDLCLLTVQHLKFSILESQSRWYLFYQKRHIG